MIFGLNSLEWLLSLSKGDWSEILWLPSLDIDQAQHALVSEALRLLDGRIIEAKDSVKLSSDADVLLGAGPGTSLSKLLSALDVSSVILAITAVNQRNRGWSKRHGLAVSLLMNKWGELLSGQEQLLPEIGLSHPYRTQCNETWDMSWSKVTFHHRVRSNLISHTYRQSPFCL